MKILLGTTNPSKRIMFEEILGEAFEYLTLRDLSIDFDVDETGKTPLENVLLKAKAYGGYNDIVICQDSGLFFSDYDLTDPIQPNTHIRRVNGVTLTDEEMLNHYLNIAHLHGGQIFAFYLNAYAISVKGKVTGYMNIEDCKKRGFFIVDKPHPKRNPGWPLDSITKRIGSNEYIVEEKELDNSNKEIIAKVKDFFMDNITKYYDLITK